MKSQIDIGRDRIASANCKNKIRVIVSQICPGIVEIVFGVERFIVDESLHEAGGEFQPIADRSQVADVRTGQMAKGIGAADIACSCGTSSVVS